MAHPRCCNTDSIFPLFVVSHCSPLLQVYATVPTVKMGQMFLYDVFLNNEHHVGWEAFSLDDVDLAFEDDRMVPLRYAEPRRLPGRGSGITITPLAAGHMVGGAIWKINKEMEVREMHAAYSRTVPSM